MQFLLEVVGCLKRRNHRAVGRPGRMCSAPRRGGACFGKAPRLASDIVPSLSEPFVHLNIGDTPSTAVNNRKAPFFVFQELQVAKNETHRERGPVQSQNISFGGSPVLRTTFGLRTWRGGKPSDAAYPKFHTANTRLCTAKKSRASAG